VVGGSGYQYRYSFADIINPVMDSDEAVLNTSPNILDDGVHGLYWDVVGGPNADLWYSAIEGEMDPLRRNHTEDMVDTSTDRRIADSKRVLKIKDLSCRSVGKVNARLVAKGLS
jgi:hypothetical protein